MLKLRVLWVIAVLLIAGCGQVAVPDLPELAQGQRFYMQLSGIPHVPEGAEIVILDGADTPESTVRSLQEGGATVFCYLNAGGYEDWRTDADQFNTAVIGAPLDDWPGEYWLDIRAQDDLLPIMAARMDQCQAKGFDGVDPDNVDGYGADTGFDLTQTDAVTYLHSLASLAHERGLAIGLKNAIEVIPELVGSVDFAVNEQCLEYSECDAYQPLLDAGAPVLHIEYTLGLEQVCSAVPEGFSSMVSDDDAGGGGQMCPGR